MEMGTGKTLTTIAIAGALWLTGRIKRVLIVAPLSIVGVWEQEFAKFADYLLPFFACFHSLIITHFDRKCKCHIRIFADEPNRPDVYNRSCKSAWNNILRLTIFIWNWVFPFLPLNPQKRKSKLGRIMNGSMASCC